jgi:hypothetical protein
MNGVLLITVVGPTKPGGALATGMFVAPGRAMNGAPFINVAPAPGITGMGDSAGPSAAKVVGAGTTMKGAPPIIVVTPARPGGASSAAIVVGAGITTMGAG